VLWVVVGGGGVSLMVRSLSVVVVVDNMLVTIFIFYCPFRMMTTCDGDNCDVLIFSNDDPMMI